MNLQVAILSPYLTSPSGRLLPPLQTWNMCLHLSCISRKSQGLHHQWQLADAKQPSFLLGQLCRFADFFLFFFFPQGKKQTTSVLTP